MKLIADCGATGSRWGAVCGGEVSIINSLPLNAATMSADEMVKAVADALQQAENRFGKLRGVKAEVYAAGARGECAERFTEILRRIFPKDSSITTGSDMTLSARASLGEQSGIACILGTGSNSCLWNGHGITGQTPSLGYVLGDEGSGASIGKRLVSNYLKGLYSTLTSRLIRDAFPELTVDTAIERVYRSTGANRWLAGFVPFISANKENKELLATAESEIENFFNRNIKSYNQPAGTLMGFTGGVAATFQETVRQKATVYGFKETRIASDPLRALIDMER